MKKGKEKRRKNYIKNGEKGLKYASLWRTPAANLFVGETMNQNGGEMIKMHNIYPWWKMNFRLVFALLCLFLLGVEVPDQILAMI